MFNHLKRIDCSRKCDEYKLPEDQLNRLTMFIELLITIDKRINPRSKEEKDQMRLEAEEARKAKKIANITTHWRLCTHGRY